MEKKRSDHWQLGYAHCAAGMKKYKFQDPYLQSQYDAGWEHAVEGGDYKLNKAFMEDLRRMQERKKW